MRAYVRARQGAKPFSELLFVLSAGDNFYWEGASSGRFNESWRAVYGELTDVPWFAVMGNHDFGNADHEAVCPEDHARVVCSEDDVRPACGGTTPYSTRSQAYAGNQLDANKGGLDEDRGNFHMPDYAYYYCMPALDLEIIAHDENARHVSVLGGDELAGGASRLVEPGSCGSAARLDAWFQSLSAASRTLVRDRARAAAHSNYALVSHFNHDGDINPLLQLFQDNAGAASERMRVLNFYGHAHQQRCDLADAAVGCANVLSGGGGGCCASDRLSTKGFVAVSFSDGASAPQQMVECLGQSTKPPWGACTLEE